MMSVRYSNEVLRLLNTHQKSDIQGFDLLDFPPNIKGFFDPFLAIKKANILLPLPVGKLR